MARKATDAQLASVSSHSVSLDHHNRREELFPRVDVTWNGRRLRAELETSRYEHSSGWSAWRVFVRRARLTPETETEHGYSSDVNLSDTASAAMNEVAVPVVEAWLSGAEYDRSRRRAFWHALSRSLEAPPSYRLDRFGELLEEYVGELEPAAAVRMRNAVRLLEEARAELDAGDDGR